jgi:RNA polymerase sigma factor (sigma-70 family)
MDEPSSVSVWLGRLPDGDHDALEKLLNRYREQVVQYAGYRLRQLGVRLKDAEDIAQEVFLGLYRRIESGQMRDLQDRSDLWLRLRRLVGDRVKEAKRKKLAFTESALNPNAKDDDTPAIYHLPDSDMEECVLIVEHSLLKRHLAEQHQDLPEIARLRMQGYSVQEIADRMGNSKKTTENRLKWIRLLCDEYMQMSG